MPTFNIDQKSEGLTIVVAGEPTEAYVWERKDGEFKNTGELKKNADGVQIWNASSHRHRARLSTSDRHEDHHRVQHQA